jgi:hypothetical protein
MIHRGGQSSSPKSGALFSYHFLMSWTPLTATAGAMLLAPVLAQVFAGDRFPSAISELPLIVRLTLPDPPATQLSEMAVYPSS